MEVDDLTKQLIVAGLLNHTYRFCNKCGLLLEKDGGCNYVKCFCGFELCWECGQEKYTFCNNSEHNSH